MSFAKTGAALLRVTVATLLELTLQMIAMALYLSLAKTGATLLPVATATSRELPR